MGDVGRWTHGSCRLLLLTLDGADAVGGHVGGFVELAAEELAFDDDEFAGREIREDLRIVDQDAAADLVLGAFVHVVDGPLTVGVKLKLSAEPFLFGTNAKAGVRAVAAGGLFADRGGTEAAGTWGFGSRLDARLAPLGAEAIGRGRRRERTGRRAAVGGRGFHRADWSLVFGGGDAAELRRLLRALHAGVGREGALDAGLVRRTGDGEHRLDRRAELGRLRGCTVAAAGASPNAEGSMIGG